MDEFKSNTAQASQMGGINEGKFYNRAASEVVRIGSGEPQDYRPRVGYAETPTSPPTSVPQRQMSLVSRGLWRGFSACPAGLLAESTQLIPLRELSDVERARFEQELAAELGERDDLRATVLASAGLIAGTDVFGVALDFPERAVVLPVVAVPGFMAPPWTEWDFWTKSVRRIFLLADAVKMLADPQTNPLVELHARHADIASKNARNAAGAEELARLHDEAERPKQARQARMAAWQVLPVDARVAIRTARATGERSFIEQARIACTYGKPKRGPTDYDVPEFDAELDAVVLELASIMRTHG